MYNSILPKYSKVLYRLNRETKYFLQTAIEAQQTPINRLPLEMRLAPAKAGNVTPNASRLLLSREVTKGGKYRFITGIQQTLHSDWFLGNDYEYCNGVKKISLILFHFIDEGEGLEVYYFHRYDKPNSGYRLQFANGVIPNLQKIAA
jgi:hypothetical protein